MQECQNQLGKRMVWAIKRHIILPMAYLAASRFSETLQICSIGASAKGDLELQNGQNQVRIRMVWPLGDMSSFPMAYLAASMPSESLWRANPQW